MSQMGMQKFPLRWVPRRTIKINQRYQTPELVDCALPALAELVDSVGLSGAYGADVFHCFYSLRQLDSCTDRQSIKIIVYNSFILPPDMVDSQKKSLTCLAVVYTITHNTSRRNED